MRGLALAPEEIASRTGLPVDRVRAILEDAPVGAAELRALAKGLRIPLRVFATGRFLSDNDSDLALLFRDVPNRDKLLDPTIEHVASFVDAAIKLLPTRERPPEWLASFDVRGTTYAAFLPARSCRVALNAFTIRPAFTTFPCSRGVR